MMVQGKWFAAAIASALAIVAGKIMSGLTWAANIA
jgi:hypothetical protein